MLKIIHLGEIKTSTNAPRLSASGHHVLDTFQNYCILSDITKCDDVDSGRLIVFHSWIMEACRAAAHQSQGQGVELPGLTAEHGYNEGHCQVPLSGCSAS